MQLCVIINLSFSAVKLYTLRQHRPAAPNQSQVLRSGRDSALLVGVNSVILHGKNKSEIVIRHYFRKWAKSTLILIPLFGVHYAILHGMSYSRGVNEKVELVWLFCDQFFASFQVWIPRQKQFGMFKY